MDTGGGESNFKLFIVLFFKNRGSENLPLKSNSLSLINVYTCKYTRQLKSSMHYLLRQWFLWYVNAKRRQLYLKKNKHSVVVYHKNDNISWWRSYVPWDFISNIFYKMYVELAFTFWFSLNFIIKLDKDFYRQLITFLLLYFQLYILWYLYVWFLTMLLVV